MNSIINFSSGAVYLFDGYLEIKFNDSEKYLKLFYIWLRDHCKCSQCYNQTTKQISHNVLNIPLDIKPLRCEIIETTLKLHWDTSHVTEYCISSLMTLDFPLQSKKEIVLWNKENFANFKDVEVPVDVYFKDNIGITLLLKSILTYGFGFVIGVEPSIEATERVILHMAAIQKTIFGEMWRVTNDYYHNDTAYTNISLTPHTDNTYFTEAAGLQIFHMLSHEGTGGETVLVDGFNIATQLKNINKTAFDVLVREPLESQYLEEGFNFSTIQPVINLHPVTKNLFQIRFNIYDRATFNSIAENKILEFYKSYQLFGNMIRDKNNSLELKLTPGNVIFIDNWRVLHGRNSYTGTRDLCGCYVSRSEWLSKAKSLELQID